MDIASTTMTTPIRPGKSAQAVGQMAKIAVTEAKAAGVDLPKNAQGMAASAISKGADPSTVFAALATPDPIADDVATTNDVLDVPSDVDSDVVAVPATDETSEGPTESADAPAQVAADRYAAAADAIAPNSIQDSAENALELLKAAT